MQSFAVTGLAAMMHNNGSFTLRDRGATVAQCEPDIGGVDINLPSLHTSG